MLKNLTYKYSVYIMYFLGIGMVSSSIVLMPFNYIRYSIILGIGLGLFITGSLFNEVVIDHHHLTLWESINLVTVSLTLAIGIGMISGGISHFKESPQYISYLIPSGVVISLVSFTLKNDIKLSRSEKFTLFIGVVILAILLYLGLSFLSSDMVPGGDIYKGGH